MSTGEKRLLMPGGDRGITPTPIPQQMVSHHHDRKQSSCYYEHDDEGGFSREETLKEFVFLPYVVEGKVL